MSGGIDSHTGGALDAMLHGLPEGWTDATEGSGTWSPYVVIGHLARNERGNWMPRLLTILESGARAVASGRSRGGGEREEPGGWLDEFAALRGRVCRRCGH